MYAYFMYDQVNVSAEEIPAFERKLDITFCDSEPAILGKSLFDADLYQKLTRMSFGSSQHHYIHTPLRQCQ